MFEVNDFLTRLQNGESPEVIAKEFADALNEAEAMQKAKSKETEKLAEFQTLCDSVIRFFAKWYPELPFENVEIDAEQTLQEITGMMDLMRGLVPAIDKPKAKKNTDEGVDKNRPVKNSDEVLVSFLRDMGLM
jgi:hypothetical protein